MLIELLKKLDLDKRLSEYEFIENISGTGNSSAIKALNRKTSQYVFIKFLLFPRHESEISKFQNEIYITEKQGNYSVFSCFPRYFEGGVLVENYIYYFVTEWIDGITLKNLIPTLREAGDKEKLSVFYQIVRALTACLGIEHRDLHPNNIFIIQSKFEEFQKIGYQNDSVSPGIKIIDFGEATMPMATQYDDSPDFLYESYFQNGKRIVTAFNYLAPELFLPLLDNKFIRRLNENSDLWSLGIIFYLIFFEENLFSYSDIGSYLESMNNGSMKRRIEQASESFLRIEHPSKEVIHQLFNNIMKVNYKERLDLGDIQNILWQVINNEIAFSTNEIHELIKNPINFLDKKGLLEDVEYY
ncbi:protein kinase domain-containing protein [Acinetobacter kanungonis]|uniref:protein kinase domain-containing protein n=1 Tax=Acinetobacter kanungonis TaxID=2699469 RepID=UPI00137AC9DE|nr:protein kinase [Acinetobacter kanungonis]NCI78944.1 protein kinase [Acinetobacter kanungonis]